MARYNFMAILWMHVCMGGHPGRRLQLNAVAQGLQNGVPQNWGSQNIQKKPLCENIMSNHYVKPLFETTMWNHYVKPWCETIKNHYNQVINHFCIN